MKNALILHGTGSNSSGNWFPWLKNELEKRGRSVWVPDLPRADNPNIEKYNAFIFGNHDFQLNAETILIGHSSGAVAILGLLQSLPDTISVDTCILVGAFKDDLGRDDLRGLFTTPFDFERIKKHAKKLIFIHSDNDPYVPLDQVKYLSEKLNGELLVKERQGHFNLEMGEKYKQFPLLLELLDNRVDMSL